MGSSQRTIISLCMTLLYLLIVLAPLAPLAMHSPRIAHAVTGECSGDCTICGCAPERSAARACCCWQKKRAAEHLQTVARRNGLSEAAPADSVAKTPPCCQKNRPAIATAPCGSDDGHEHDSSATPVARESDRSDVEHAVTTISSCPCNSGKQLFYGGYETGQHLPSLFNGGIPTITIHISSLSPSDRLASRHDEPPVPPPRIFSFC